ncbi:MAG: hypothetical protein LBC78_02185 [Oscillospiraceae bacterium]|jgi:hypothetical protein|nr:hypothetical protein [Oscillospiraceae bacterium]
MKKGMHIIAGRALALIFLVGVTAAMAIKVKTPEEINRERSRQQIAEIEVKKAEEIFETR